MDIQAEHGNTIKDMSKYTLITSILSLLWCYLGYKTVMHKYKNNTHVLFGVLCFSMIIWTFFIGITYSLDSMDLIILSLKTGYTGGFLYAPVIFHFYLILSGTEIKTCYLVLNYLPYIFLIISNWIDFFIFSEVTRFGDEWLGILNTGSIRMYLYIVLLLVTFLLAVFVLFKWNRTTKSNKERIQSRHMIVFFSISCLACYVLTCILPFFRIYQYQFIGMALMQLFVLGLYFMVFTFRFMNLASVLPFDEIIANISEIVFVLDMDLRIIKTNKTADMILRESNWDAANRSFPGILTDSREFVKSIKNIVDGRIDNFIALLNFSTVTGNMAVKTYISCIKDRFNDISGFLIISSELRDVEKFRKIYMITDRELEITGLIVSGLSYKEISGKLGISERTVERHLTNIYNKLGINNKIELYRIAGEYNIRI
ncbi:MAG TPA: LuxR C-terminal-related transcriptional regulator [Spirochaetota bacterium]|nr:LuxR C-terminal-related transcriptional regulator [Spirochaetota bacterium]